MVRHALPNGPWWDIAIDISGPTPWGANVLVETDYYYQWVEVAILKNRALVNSKAQFTLTRIRRCEVSK